MGGGGGAIRCCALTQGLPGTDRGVISHRVLLHILPLCGLSSLVQSDHEHLGSYGGQVGHHHVSHLVVHIQQVVL